MIDLVHYFFLSYFSRLFSWWEEDRLFLFFFLFFFFFFLLFFLFIFIYFKTDFFLFLKKNSQHNIFLFLSPIFLHLSRIFSCRFVPCAASYRALKKYINKYPGTFFSTWIDRPTKVFLGRFPLPADHKWHFTNYWIISTQYIYIYIYIYIRCCLYVLINLDNISDTISDKRVQEENTE